VIISIFICTEFACSPWSGGTCDETKNLALMQQVMPVLHDNPKVFRYSWYSVWNTGWVINR